MGAWYWSLGRKTQAIMMPKAITSLARRLWPGLDLKTADLCKVLWDLLIFHSFGDNTSPRFVPLLMNQFLVVYGKKPNLKFAGPPGFHSHGGALQFLLDHSHDLRSFSLCLHGQPRKPSNDICQCNLDIIHTNPHHLIGQVVSIIITSLQFDSTLNVNLTDFPTNLVPYPHIYFPRATYSQASQLRRPIVSSKIISACLKLASQMAKYDLPQQVHGLWHVVLEGQANINTAFTSNRMKRNTQFVDVAQLDLKWTSTTSPLIIIPRGDLAKEQQSVGVLSNTTAMAEVWACLNRKFDLMKQSEHLCIVCGERHVGRRGFWGPGELGSSGERWRRGRHGF